MKMKMKKFTFKGKSIRHAWISENEKWLLSIVDIIAILTDSPNPRKYWSVLKTRLKQEGSQLATNCSQLKLKASDGKHYLTDVGTTKQILRLVQSIPSKKAEPFKLWLAEVGNERINETADPELAINRALRTYLEKGYSKEWVNQRLKSIEIRKDLTNEWEKRGVKEGKEFAVLTDEISKAWSEMTTKEYKNFKNLKKENLRDNLTNMELVLNMLAEATTTEISKNKLPEGLEESKVIAKEGGTIAGNAKKEIEKKTGKKIISRDNFTEKKLRLK